jgi:IPT/TIG domain-containing protein
MARLDLARSSMLAGLVAAIALTGCGGGLMLTDAPGRSLRAEARHVETEERGEVLRSEHGDRAERRQPAVELGAAPVQAEPDVEIDISEAPYHLAPEAARAVDLEFSAGLSEPTQEQVVSPPPAWKPAARDEATGAPVPVIEDVWPNKAPAAGSDDALEHNSNRNGHEHEIEIVIKGKNLTASQVLFGMAPARIVEVTAHSLTVAAPAAGAGEVAIVVTNRDGSFAIATQAFSYYR